MALAIWWETCSVRSCGCCVLDTRSYLSVCLFDTVMQRTRLACDGASVCSGAEFEGQKLVGTALRKRHRTRHCHAQAGALLFFTLRIITSAFKRQLYLCLWRTMSTVWSPESMWQFSIPAMVLQVQLKLVDPSYSVKSGLTEFWHLPLDLVWKLMVIGTIMAKVAVNLILQLALPWASE